ADHGDAALPRTDDDPVAVRALRVMRPVQRPGEDGVAERDLVPPGPDARRLVDRPAEGAVVDHDVANRTARRVDLQGVAIVHGWPFGRIADAHAYVLHQDIRGLDRQSGSSQQHAGRGRRLAGDRDVGVADHQVPVHGNRAGYFE